MQRMEQERDEMRSERDAIGEKHRAEVDASNRLRSRLGVVNKEVAALRTEVAHLREQGRASRIELGLMREELAVARDRCMRAEAEGASQKMQIADLRKTADLRKLLRESQVACEGLQKELSSLKEDMNRRESELVKLQEDLKTWELRARQASESERVLSSECANLRVALALREEKDAQEAELRRRHPFFYERRDFLRKKAPLDEESSPPYPHKGKIGGADVDWHSYYVLMSQIGEYHWKYLEVLLGFPAWRTVQRRRKDMGDEL